MKGLLRAGMAIILFTGLCSLATAEERAFQGIWSSQLTDNARAYDMNGQATHLGRAQASMNLRHSPRTFFGLLLELFKDDPIARSSLVTFVAADGSTLQGIIRYDTFDDESLIATAEITILGGTERFVDAAGTIDVLLSFTDNTLIQCDVLMLGTLDY